MNTKTIKKSLSINSNYIHLGELILVNKDYAIMQNEEIFEKEIINIGNISLNKECLKKLKLLLKCIKSNGNIAMVSGYRTKELQKQIYEDSIKENGEEFTKSYVAYPGNSEHQTGFAIDVGLKSNNIDFIRPEFPDKSIICLKFKSVADKFGFINRYKKNKEKITNIKAEEWHFRYVGYPHSHIINNLNFCLEEYIEYIKNYTYNNPYKYVDNKNIIYVYYIESGKDKTQIPIIEHGEYKISGNNIDGFIITIFNKKDREYKHEK